MELFTIDTILPAASGILFITQAIYHLGLYNKLYIHNKETVYTTDINAENPPLSVIIVAKDAADELQENLPFILEQDYPEFEVIVIYDRSADDCDDTLKLLEDKYPNLYHTFIPDSARYISHKKLGITKIPIRGVIWYQGEANVGRADEYADLFMSLISDWRDKWKQPDMPFYFVQLANFLKKEEIQPDSEWAALREAQSKALYLNNTGMAVTTDLGEANNIHPKNKQEVGLRLSQLALKQTYKKKRMPQSPLFKSYRIEGNTIRIGFDNPGKGFMKPDTIKGFIIAGADHIFYPATVTIQKKEIIVESPDVPHPVAVRYNWADNPDGNLYGLSGLPTAPFRTDNW